MGATVSEVSTSEVIDDLLDQLFAKISVPEDLPAPKRAEATRILAATREDCERILQRKMRLSSRIEGGEVRCEIDFPGGDLKERLALANRELETVYGGEA